ncbi:zf-HC2 domain-containing protein [Microbacterium sp. EST19A]|uniref:anti-sigma factor n=1 Tax=Microbacterium sp. EST19A TaxID=2862681 RepID=UPI001CBB5FEF|nr:zf-HC2 domain-containing protein [Microbacterium sp. EST19A]
MIPDEYTEWDAAYVLGALSVSDRHEFDRHLSGCRSCRQSVNQLAPLPGMLAAVPSPAVRATPPVASEADAAASASRARTARAERVHRRKRTRRTRVAAVALGLMLLGGAAGYAVTMHVGSTVTATESLRLKPVADSGVQADLSITTLRGSTRLDWSCSYPPGIPLGHDYELAVVDADGIRTVVATWAGDGTSRTAGLSATTATPADEITRIELSAAASGRLLAATDH